MAITLGQRSLARLDGVHPKLVRVIMRAAAMARPDEDFTVLEGVRTLERQKALYAQGRTAPGKIVTWTLKSNHFRNPRTGFGHAVDLAPFPIDWNDSVRFDRLAGLMFRAASIEGVKIRWGADWDQDGKPRERGESDSPHFELA
ncbi:MAG: M15 family metallopeptidase [Novosphingobium sp.]|uniref:M15 family metallopeptidase n=1 Tax=Novosphingobium sp. TaxID=1874826 RepID=UPI0026154212|nr:M15 family metallopeptidase [Novosphingobium sp.]MCP5385937.1 M15 family metallopeptidase [Novosphingobium sp.]